MIVRAALILTLCVFISFSMIAMMTKNKRFFPVGCEISLYGRLLMFIGYVFYDTQQIIKRVERFGLDKTDYISDAITLYIDFVAIFIRILIIILRSKEKDGGYSRPILKTRNKMDL